jgi:hypothetical protein
MQGPIHSSSWAFNNQVDYYAYSVEKAAPYFSNVGYTKNTETGYFESTTGDILSFTLSYLDNDLNNRVVNSLVALLDKEGIVNKAR